MSQRQDASLNKRFCDVMENISEGSTMDSGAGSDFGPRHREGQKTSENQQHGFSRINETISQTEVRSTRDSQLPENYSQICKELQEGDHLANRRLLEEELAFLTKEHQTVAILNSAFVSLNNNLDIIRKKLSTLEKNASCTESLLSCWNQFLIRTMNNSALISDPSWPGVNLDENKQNESILNESLSQPQSPRNMDHELESSSNFSQKRAKRQSLKALYRTNSFEK